MGSANDRTAVRVDQKGSPLRIIVETRVVERCLVTELVRPPDAKVIPGYLATPWVEVAHIHTAKRIAAADCSACRRTVANAPQARIERTSLVPLAAEFT